MNEQESLETVLEQALELADPQERAAYLAEACGDNEAMRAEVESLLAAEHFCEFYA